MAADNGKKGSKGTVKGGKMWQQDIPDVWQGRTHHCSLAPRRRQTRTSLPLVTRKVKSMMKRLTVRKHCKRGVLLEESELEQWQEVIS